MTTKNVLPAPLRDWIDDPSIGYSRCAVINCRNRATVGRYCARCDEELRALDVMLHERWRKRQQDLERRRARGQAYVQRGIGACRRLEWIGTAAVVMGCLFWIGYELAPWFVDLAARIRSIFGGN